MTDNTPGQASQSPEVQPAAVRDELHQAGVSHEGTRQPVRVEHASGHLGANELDVTPVIPPMRGPGNVIGPDGRDDGDDGDDDSEDSGIDPVDEMTPG